MYNYQPYQPYYPNFGAQPDTLTALRQNPMQQNFTPQAAPQAMQQPQPQSGLPIFVQGEAGAKSYLVAPGNTLFLFDSEEPIFYIKSSDASGVPMPLRTFRYTETTGNDKARQAPVAAQNPATVDYVTREEFERRIAEILGSNEQKGE